MKQLKRFMEEWVGVAWKSYSHKQKKQNWSKGHVFLCQKVIFTQSQTKPTHMLPQTDALDIGSLKCEMLRI